MDRAYLTQLALPVDSCCWKSQEISCLLLFHSICHTLLCDIRGQGLSGVCESHWGEQMIVTANEGSSRPLNIRGQDFNPTKHYNLVTIKLSLSRKRTLDVTSQNTAFKEQTQEPVMDTHGIKSLPFVGAYSIAPRVTNAVTGVVPSRVSLQYL